MTATNLLNSGQTSVLLSTRAEYVCGRHVLSASTCHHTPSILLLLNVHLTYKTSIRDVAFNSP